MASSSDDYFFRQGEVCKIIGLTPRQIQYWEKTGLLVPSYRTQGGHRRYTFQDLVACKTAKKLLDAGNVPSEDRYMVIHANNVAGLLADERAISNDFAVKALLNGEVSAMLGFKIIVVGDRSEGGLPLSTNDRTCYAFHKSAMGMAEGMGIKTEINYVPEKTSFLVNSMFSAGAVAIDDEGIVKITCDES